METTINIGVTRDKLTEMVAELQAALDKDSKYIEHTFYCKPNGYGVGDEVIIVFSNDDMEADVNPDIDGGHAYVSVEMS